MLPAISPLPCQTSTESLLGLFLPKLPHVGTLILRCDDSVRRSELSRSQFFPADSVRAVLSRSLSLAEDSPPSDTAFEDSVFSPHHRPTLRDIGCIESGALASLDSKTKSCLRRPAKLNRFHVLFRSPLEKPRSVLCTWRRR